MFPLEDETQVLNRAAAAPSDAESRVNSADEALLVTRLAAFDPDAWSAVFERYFTAIFRIAYVRTRQRSAAEDIAAQTFAEAANGIRRYRYRGVPFRAWLYRIARNLTSDHIKAERRRPQVSLDETHAIEVPGVERDSYVDFLAALDGLTEDQKAVLVLRLVEGYSLAEVAETVGKSVGAVKQLQARAVSTLQQRMAVDVAAEADR